jgi:formiminotetrahydrofolate cyclodeaminase
MGLVEEDSVAFDEVMNTFKMPEDTPAEKKQKAKAVQATTKGAAEVPLQTMRHSFKALEGAKIAAEKGNINTITDAGMAALSLLAAIEGAALNVKVNLGNITDKDFSKKMGDEVEDLLAKGRALKEEIMVIVEDRMKQLSESS